MRYTERVQNRRKANVMIGQVSPAPGGNFEAPITTALDHIDNFCARCRGSRVFRYLHKTDASLNPEGIAMRVPAFFDRSCPLCALFKELRKCENAEQIPHGPPVKKLNFWIQEEQLQNSALKYYAIRCRCSYCPMVNTLRLFSLRMTDAFPFDTQWAAGRVISAKKANLNLVKSWLERCNMYHRLSSTSCWSSHAHPSPARPLCVIDCKTRLVRLLKAGEPYVCLSYVWGSFKCSTSTFGLGTRLPKYLPKTISDAIYVATKLGIPQLWVDEYCINQHDVQKRLATIRSMDVIYGGAALTIIAASGTDAFSGLPGICRTVRSPQKVLTIGDIQFIISKSTREQVKSSRWNTRGWTYQEALLSSRTLVFTDTHVYFQCKREHHLEFLGHGLENSGNDFSESFQVFPHSVFSSNPDDVYDRLIEYIPRDLTYASDGIAAFEGILNAFDNCPPSPGRAKHFHGIPLFNQSSLNQASSHQLDSSPFTPTQAFMNGLAWSLKAANSNPKTTVAAGATRSEFPSWTWASFKTSSTHNKTPLEFKYCLRRNLAIADNIRVDVFHAIQGPKDINEASTLHAIAEDPSSFLPSIQITTSAIGMVLGPNAAYSPEYAQSYEGVFRLDDTDHNKDSQCWALFIGKNKDPSERNLRIKKRLAFLLVVEADGAGNAYRRIGLWFLNCLEWSHGKKRSDHIDKFLNRFSLEEGREFVEQGIFRIV
ncbi:hypothetical protein HBI21_154190 [Parastagonospora nodorum]|nr:hypothetical protein HBI21_154190 [Parastagonospora nodorum]